MFFTGFENIFNEKRAARKSGSWKRENEYRKANVSRLACSFGTVGSLLAIARPAGKIAVLHAAETSLHAPEAVVIGFGDCGGARRGGRRCAVLGESLLVSGNGTDEDIVRFAFTHARR